jgi:hypothetical protein
MAGEIARTETKAVADELAAHAMTPYFRRDEDRFVPTEIARGGWGPSLSGHVVGGLLASVVERAVDDPELLPARLTVDLPAARPAAGRRRVVTTDRDAPLPMAGEHPSLFVRTYVTLSRLPGGAAYRPGLTCSLQRRRGGHRLGCAAGHHRPGGYLCLSLHRALRISSTTCTGRRHRPKRHSDELTTPAGTGTRRRSGVTIRSQGPKRVPSSHVSGECIRAWDTCSRHR